MKKIILVLFSVLIVLFVLGCSDQAAERELESELAELSDDELLEVADAVVEGDEALAGQAASLRSGGQSSNWYGVSSSKRQEVLLKEISGRLRQRNVGLIGPNYQPGDNELIGPNRQPTGKVGPND